MIDLLAFSAKLASWKAKLAVALTILASIYGLRQWDIHNQRSIGESRHAAKVEAATNEAVSKANDAGIKSSTAGVGGVRNPRYRD